MSPDNRTPREPPGEGLVPITVLIPPSLKAELDEASAKANRSLSYTARMAIEFWWDEGGPVR